MSSFLEIETNVMLKILVVSIGPWNVILRLFLIQESSSYYKLGNDWGMNTRFNAEYCDWFLLKNLKEY